MMYYFYHLFIDPLLKPLRKQIAEMVPGGGKIIDFACGTGNQTMMLAEKSAHITGIDLNSRMIDKARIMIPAQYKDTVVFQTADGRNIHFAEDNEFDIATITLALHEMNEDIRLPVLSEMKRVAKHLIIADYDSPQPRNYAGIMAVIIEKLAGKRHYAGFRSYQNSGGLNSLLKEAGIEIQEEYSVLGGSIRVLNCPVPD